MTIEYTPLSKLERDDIARQALESAARKLEERSSNKLYMAAWKVAAKIVRSMKPA